MAQKSGFFNALLNNGVYDRTYNADDYSDCLATIISNGVQRSANDGLKIIASNLNLTMNVGKAFINGKYYINDSLLTLPPVTPPTGGSRIDNVVLRYDISLPGRIIDVQYVVGTASSNPTAPALTRSSDVYELCLARITVAANASSVTVTDTRSDPDLCGWIYSTAGDNSFFVSLDNQFYEWFDDVKDTLSSVTLFKQYKWESTISSQTDRVTFSISQYDADTCILEVYINGMLEENYTLSGSTVIFDGTMKAGTDVVVLVYKSIDGTGIMTVADEITALQNAVAALSGVSDFTYKATGSDDNIALSEIAQAIYSGEYDSSTASAAANAFLTALGGNEWLASLDDNCQITIHVVGNISVETASNGAGTEISPYRWFNFGISEHSGKHIVFDFASADVIKIECAASTYNTIFYGTDLDIRDVSLEVTCAGSACAVQVIAGGGVGIVNAENCRFDIFATGDCVIANQGTFTNCFITGKSSAGHAMLFVPNTNTLIRLIGGTFKAYRMLTNKTGCVFYTSSTDTNAVAIGENINAPTVAVDGYTQDYLAVAYGGQTLVNIVTTTLDSTGSYQTVSNKITLSKTM